ncbi:DOT1-domain-containing protein, partial [Atractiella rhizophila]
LVHPTAHDGYEYHPILDLRRVISLVLQFFLTAEQAFDHFGYSQLEGSTTSECPIPLLDQLDRAYLAQDGVAFTSTVEWYNRTMRKLKESGSLKENIQKMNGLPRSLWEPIADQTYERTIGPNVGELKKYESWSNNVYGELLPNFLEKIFSQTGLREGMVFVDLGSGVSNCTIQAALATGCEAYGYENLSSTASLGSLQVEEARKRWKMWGVRGGQVEAREDDIVTSESLGEVMQRADVILCNNQVFSATLNRSIADRFLDLREGAMIVSLQPFKATDFKLSLYKCNSVEAILMQSPPLEYAKQHVSWTDKAGTYFIAKVDRQELRQFMEKQSQTSQASHTTKRRR